MAKSLRFGNTIVCEHIASGGGNKLTLINMFSGDIIVAQYPANLMLAFYIEIERQTGWPPAMQLEIRLDKQITHTFQIVGDQAGDSIGAIPLPAGVVHLETDVELSVWAKAEGFRDTKVLSKRIYKGEIPAA